MNPADQRAALDHVSRAWEWFYGMVAMSATNTGIELGLFDRLREAGPQSPSELAETLQLQPRAIETWAKTLLHYGLLEAADADRVQLAPGVELMVCDRSTLFNLAPSFAYHARFLARDFLDLPAFFRDGQPIPPGRHGEEFTRNIADQTAAMHAIFVASILGALPEVEEPLARGGNLLDAGCGTGNLGLLLAATYPEMRYSGYDLDAAAIALGQPLVRELGFGDRVELRCADVSAAPAGLFDVAMLFLALHEVAPAGRPGVAAALRRALHPGGWLVVFDETYPESLSEAAERSARMGLHFEYTEMLWGSRVPTRHELDTLLREAGFTSIERRSVLEGSFEIVLARAP